MASQGGPRKRGTTMKMPKTILKQQMSIGKWVIGPSQCPWPFNKHSLKMRHSKSNVRVLDSYVACQLSARGRRDALNVFDDEYYVCQRKMLFIIWH